MLKDEKAEDCKIFFDKLKNEEIEVSTSDFIIYACLLEIQYKYKSPKYLRNFILFINEMKGLRIFRPSIKEIYDSVDIAEKYKLDFDDSLVVSLMINNDIKGLISFDKHFDKISIVKREVP